MRDGNRRWWALGALSLAVLAVGLDGTVLSVALPTLATALHASESDLQWFSSGYLLVLAAAMLPAGLLGDRYGRKKVLLASLALFGAGSALCAYSTSPGAFIAARMLLGVAGAGIIVMVLAAFTVLFNEEERPRAVGIWSAANSLALPIGPILGGWLLTNYWWGWVFLLNVPVALIGLAVAAALVPESRAAHRPGLDTVGVVASAAGLVSVTYGLIQAGQHGWASAGALLPIFAGLAVLAGFIQFERWLGSRPGGEPLIDLKLFSSPSYTWGVILVAGLLIGAVPADRVASLLGTKLAAIGGFALLAAGLILGAATSVNSGAWFVATWMAIVGAGMGLALATTASAALAELSEDQSGVGSAVLQAVNKTGGPFGAAILGSVLLTAYQSSVDLSGLPPPAAAAVRSGIFGGVAVARKIGSPALLGSVRTSFVHGIDLALVVSAGIAMAGLVLAAAFLPRQTAGKMAVPVQEADTVPTT